MAGADELTGAYFSSGAEPSLHVRMIVETALSASRAGSRVWVYAVRGGRLQAALMRSCHDVHISCCEPDRHEWIQAGFGTLSLVLYDSRAQLDRLTAAGFPGFDYFVAPPHERTHWALGLGLPMFLLGPDIGPFAPLNRRLLLDSGVALPVEGTGGHFGLNLNHLRTGSALRHMAERTWGRYPANGFDVAARHLLSEIHSKGGEDGSRPR